MGPTLQATMTCDCGASTTFPVVLYPTRLPQAGCDAPDHRVVLGEAAFTDGWKLEVVRDSGNPETKWWCPTCAAGRTPAPVIEVARHSDPISTDP